jgi:hypothetical protein
MNHLSFIHIGEEGEKIAVKYGVPKKPNRCSSLQDLGGMIRTELFFLEIELIDYVIFIMWHYDGS